ncbi:hypothetical protein BD289DRAFT_139193 [Coniella lustricola]|uniref:Uncharacterized protein n=1 Tax=Coniella lustricola TaxID=2025994 RepID=A0A2T2ZVC5_9PEZI|nr:hypothetical protein BD289DRAFT_139193 [Coniella lustricola]
MASSANSRDATGHRASGDRLDPFGSRSERVKVFFTMDDLRELVADMPKTSPTLQAILRDFPSSKGAAILRPGRNLNLISSKRTANIEALGIQIAGQEHESGPCTACSQGKGPFVHCFTLGDGVVLGTCGNCHYNANSYRCNFRAKKPYLDKKRGEDREMGDGDDEYESEREERKAALPGRKIYKITELGAASRNNTKRKRGGATATASEASFVSYSEHESEDGDENEQEGSQAADLLEDIQKDGDDQSPCKPRKRARRNRQRIDYKIDMTMFETDSDDLLADPKQPLLSSDAKKNHKVNNNNTNNCCSYIHRNKNPSSRRAHSLPLKQERPAPQKFGFSSAQFQPAVAVVPTGSGSLAGTGTGGADDTVTDQLRGPLPRIQPHLRRVRGFQHSERPPPVTSQQPLQTQWPTSAQALGSTLTKLPEQSTQPQPAADQQLETPHVSRPSTASTPPAPVVLPLASVSETQPPAPSQQASTATSVRITNLSSSLFAASTAAPTLQSLATRPAITVNFPFTSKNEARRFARMLHHVAVAIEDAVDNDNDAGA